MQRACTVVRHQCIADRKHLAQPGHGIRTIVIGIPARIVVVAPEDALLQIALNDLLQTRMFLLCGLIRCPLAIAPLDRETVITACALHVSVAQVGGAIFAHQDSRREVIHHRAAIERAGSKVMLQPQHVPHLMAG